MSSCKDSTPVRARIGLNGLITPMFAFQGAVGWGASFYSASGATAAPPQNFDSVIGQAELRWYITPNPSSDPAAATASLSSIAVGYRRDFVNSFLGDFYSLDRGYLQGYFFFAGRVLTSIEGGAARVGYPTVFFPDGTLRSTAFNDVRADATGFVEYRISDAFGINTTLRYSANLSQKKILTEKPTGPGTPTDDLAWSRIEAYLGVRWLM